MSSPEEIHFIDPFLKPVLEPPRVGERDPSKEEALFSENAPQKLYQLPLCARASVVPKKSFALFKDEKWMSLLVNVFGIASRTCFLVGGEAAEVIPVLSIVSAPFYLYHAFSKSKKRLVLVYQSFKVSQYATLAFWMMKATDAVGSAVNTVSKPFAGGAHLSGLMALTAIAILFTLVIPIILIIFGVIGALSQPWSIVRTTRALHDFEEKRERSKESLESLVALLDFLEGPKQFVKQEDDKVEKAKYELEKAHLNDTYFTIDQREKATKKRIGALLSHHNLHEIRTLTEKIASQEVQKAVDPILEKILKQLKREKSDHVEAIVALISETKEGFQELLNGTLTFSLLKKAEDLHEKLLQEFRDEKVALIFLGQEGLLAGLISDLEKHQKELLEIEEALKEGKEIVETVYADMHRKVTYHSVFLLMALISLSAGVLFLTPSSTHTVASGLSLAGSALAISQVLFDKAISEERFLQMSRYLSSLRDKKIKRA